MWCIVYLCGEKILQNLEHIHLTNLSNKHRIIRYFCYVDDILLIYNSNHTDIQNILDNFNTMYPNLKLTDEIETNNKINCPDITIQRTPTCWKTSIYRKLIFTDMIIPYSSNHPTQHKYATIRFLYNRLNTYNLQENEYKTEGSIIHNIMQNNDFPIHPYHPPPPRQTTITPDKRMTTTIQKWASFTYIGKETTFITNLFKKTEPGIALRSNNTMQSLLMQRQQTSDKYAQSGVYKLT
jgi:hypothetical protein